MSTTYAERPNTLAGLKAKRAELAKYRDQLEADIKAVTVDIDHLEAAIRIFDPEDTPAARRRYAAMHRAPKGKSTYFVLQKLREASEPLTSCQLAEMWSQNRGIKVSDSTMVVLTKRIGATLRALQKKGLVVQAGYIGALIGWRLVVNES
jgi:diphthamide synthase subunit DPH2